MQTASPSRPTDWATVPEVLKASDLAAVMGVSVDTVRRASNAGRLDAVETPFGPRYSKQSLMDYMGVRPERADPEKDEAITHSLARIAAEIDNIKRAVRDADARS